MPSLVLTCEHAGNRIPARYQRVFADAGEVLASHRGFDPGAFSLAQRLAEAWRVSLIALDISRLLIEVNRSEHHPKLYSPWSRRLTVAEREELLHDIYRPHRQQVVDAIAALPGPVLHIGVHSFTPVLDGRHRNAEIGLLYDPARWQESDFCRGWQRRLRADGDLRVRRNYPYRGSADGLTTWLRTRFPAVAYLGIELEVNQAQLTDASRIGAMAAELARSCPDQWG